MVILTPLMIQVADFLNIIIFQSSFIYLNGWSIIHLISGFILMKYIFSKRKSPYLHLGIALVAYEIFELLVIFSGSSLFRPEIGIDIFIDIVIGLVGGWLAVRFKK